MSAVKTDTRLRIDDLAQHSGIASGTIRFYQREGLIEPPERDGRIAFYCARHLERLARIRALQAKGLPLALIGDLLAREDAGENVAGWLALDTAAFGRGANTESVDPGVLADLGLDQPDVEALTAAGVLRRDADGTLAAVPGMLELITRLRGAGVPAGAIREGARIIPARLGEIAAAMAELGLQAFAGELEQIASGDKDVAEETLAKLEYLRSLAARIVSTHFEVILDRAIGERAQAYAESHR